MIPDSDAALRETVHSLARVGSCWSPSFSPDGKQLAFVSDLTGSPQVWRMPVTGGFPQAVTALDEQVSKAAWSPAGDWLAVEAAAGGGMNSQIYLVRPDGTGLRCITAGAASNNWLNLWTPAGDGLLFSGNTLRADSMDSFRYDLETGASELICQNAGSGVVESVAPDGRQMLVRRIANRGDSNVYLVDADASAERLLTEHQPPSDFCNARFDSEASQVHMIANDLRDMAYLCRIDLAAGGEPQILQAREDAELVEFALRRDGTLAALVWNQAGAHELELIDLEANQSVALVDLPGEIVDSLAFSADGALLAMTITGARLPRDIWLLHLASLALTQLTRSPHVGVDLAALAPAKLARYPAHDGLGLSGWLYLPAAGEPPYAMVLSFHGGPEAQEQPRFRYDYQSLLARGIAIFAPNVRGSSGFGKRFVNLDNGALRFDAIQDIASTARYVIDAGYARQGRLGIMGGSYGGYMTMAGLAWHPQLFAAGVNLYGVVNFKSFFQHTEAWMAAISKVEYGDPDTQGELLDALSPLQKIDQVSAPVLVLHGANDTNVPVYEAEQIVSALMSRGVPVEYILFPDEGHGFRGEHNRISAATAIVDFFSRMLLAD